ncbi:MAG: acetyl-CoA carboxylase, biotin carboxyl carrier protein [Gammaproteobacteria bacterium RIFCSPLOWO2_02_FULL_56_15]|nr:MAG: acetyl-CoA carboxylase, biotin carboxyl carrier protein [Gammaproteobacteria bacterium RIFCSPLOWO2_02_FULL_56_15]
MDIRKVKKLIEMLEESGIAEIEIHEGEESVRISRHSSVPPAAMETVVHVTDPSRAAIASGQGIPVTADGGRAEHETEGHVVKSPMVGIFYESQSPGKPPFVERGGKVVKGDVLCIIEAMKIMNQVEADTSGVIARIMVENGDPVEYGQPMFVIREE